MKKKIEKKRIIRKKSSGEKKGSKKFLKSERLEEKKKKRVKITHVIFFFVVSFGFFITFMYGYIVGLLHKHSAPVSKFIPHFVVSEIEHSPEILDEEFSIKANYDNKKVSINNTISYPHGWYFDEVKTDLDSENILSLKKYVISSPNESVKLFIIPKNINNLRSVISAVTETSVTVLSDEEVQKKCLGSLDTKESNEFDYISLYREDLSNNKIKYTQEVDSVPSLGEKDLPLNEFVVFKRDAGFIKGDDLVWTADIILEIDDSISLVDRNEYLKIADRIVSSLRIQ